MLQVSSTFVFPDLKPPTINICIDVQEFVTKLDYCSYAFFCNIIKINLFTVLLHYYI